MNDKRLYKPEGDLKFIDTRDLKKYPGSVWVEFPGLNCMRSKTFNRMRAIDRHLKEYFDKDNDIPLDINRMFKIMERLVWEMHDFDPQKPGNQKCKRCGFSKYQIRKSFTLENIKAFRRAIRISYRLRIDFLYVPKDFEPVNVKRIAIGKKARGEHMAQNKWYKMKEEQGSYDGNTENLRKYREKHGITGKAPKKEDSCKDGDDK